MAEAAFLFSDVRLLETKSLDHLGLLAAAIEDLDLISRVDKLMPVGSLSGAKLSMGQRLVGMILNGLGFEHVALHDARFF